MFNINNSILFLGDVFLDKKYHVSQEITHTPYVFNLEYPITKSNKPVPGKICLKAYDNFIIDTFGSKPIAVCLANNHIFDYGFIGFQDTISSLEKSEILYFGAGSEDNNWNNPAIVNIGKKKVYLLGYCDERTIAGFRGNERYRPAPLDFDLIKKDINFYKNKDNVIIINIHWGIVHFSLPRPDSLILARKLIDAGADAVIGHHSHIIQPIEIYKGKLIAYGLGDFLFPDMDLFKYDMNGTLCTHISRELNKKSNNTSIGAIFNANSGDYELFFFQFDGQKVVQKNNRFQNFFANRYILRNQTYSEDYFLRRLECLRWKRKIKRIYLKHILRKVV